MRDGGDTEACDPIPDEVVTFKESLYPVTTRRCFAIISQGSCRLLDVAVLRL